MVGIDFYNLIVGFTIALFHLGHRSAKGLIVVLMHVIFLSRAVLIEDRIRTTCLWEVLLFVACNAGRLESMFLCLTGRVGLGYGVVLG